LFREGKCTIIKKTENKEKGGTSLCRRMEQHLGIGILMQDIAETFEE